MKQNSVLRLIKGRKTAREFKDIPISQRLIKKVIEAGRWGPSLHHFQPWRFIIIRNKNLIKNILHIVSRKTKKIQLPSFFLCPTIRALSGTNAIIVIFNSGEFANFQKKIFSKNMNRIYGDIAKHAELSAISASIQNMILTAESLKIGSRWLSAPLFCNKEISKLLKTEDELVAILTLGYSVSRGKRSRRRNHSEIIRYID